MPKWQVIGQSRAVSLLERSLEREALAHAYLFVGPHQVGKMTLALNLAQALNCEAEKRPCGECTSCQKISSAKHVDVQVIGLNQNGDSGGDKPRVGDVQRRRATKRSGKSALRYRRTYGIGGGDGAGAAEQKRYGYDAKIG